MEEFYVYIQAYPEGFKLGEVDLSGIVFYVGKGKLYSSGLDRIDAHELEALRNGSWCNKRKREAIQAIIASGKQVVKEKIATFTNELDALTYEWGMITMVYQSPYLTNITYSTPNDYTIPHRYKLLEQVAGSTPVEEQVPSVITVPYAAKRKRKPLVSKPWSWDTDTSPTYLAAMNLKN